GIAASACDLLADTVNVRHCGVVAVELGLLRGASRAFLDASAPVRDHVVSAVCAAAADDAQRGEFHVLDVSLESAEALGERASVLYFADDDLAVFAIPPEGGAVNEAALRKASVSALPLIAQVGDLAQERDTIHQTNALLRHVEAFADVGGWEQRLSSGALKWSR
ncbi:MAG: hypothetical protein AAF349_09230, partial [Cyanobacteria bacterium P01_A01_bin.68]